MVLNYIEGDGIQKSWKIAQRNLRMFPYLGISKIISLLLDEKKLENTCFLRNQINSTLEIGPSKEQVFYSIEIEKKIYP